MGSCSPSDADIICNKTTKIKQTVIINNEMDVLLLR